MSKKLPGRVCLDGQISDFESASIKVSPPPLTLAAVISGKERAAIISLVILAHMLLVALVARIPI